MLSLHEVECHPCKHRHPCCTYNVSLLCTWLSRILRSKLFVLCKALKPQQVECQQYKYPYLCCKVCNYHFNHQFESDVCWCMVYGVWCLYDFWFNHTCLNTHHTSSTWLQDTSTVTVTHVHWYMVIWIPIIHHRPSFKIHCQKQCFQLSWYKLPSSSQCSIVFTASQCWISVWIWWTIV